MRHRRGPCEHEEVTMEFRLPELGEGIESATVTAVLVKPGEAVAAGQNVVSVETDKAAVDVPVESAGTIAQVHVKPGDKLPGGAPILPLDESGKPAAKPQQANTPPAAPSAKPASAERKRPEPAPAASTLAGAGAKVEFKLPELGEGIDAG